MKGGYQILDLRDVSLELSSETQNFTNVGVLKQLRALRDYIEKDYDYTKPLNEALKPILIRYRDGKTNELLEVSGFATIYSSNASLTYEIKCKDLMIEVVFEEKTDDYSNKYYDIKTAKYIYSKNEIVEGDLTVGGDAKLFENIVDAQGHKRFIEGDITINEIEGITQTYGKWSLSGTHLMIVIAYTISNGTELSGLILANLKLSIPKWIRDKITITFGNNVFLDTITSYNDDGTTQNMSVALKKEISTDDLYIYQYAITTTKDRSARVQFDLLIDNAEE